jgi:hypothetical protein
MSGKIKLTDRQGGILLYLEELHNEGMADHGAPMGMTRLQLGGEGPGAFGLLKRGLMEERNNLFYITEAGIAAAKQWCEETPPMRTF